MPSPRNLRPIRARLYLIVELLPELGYKLVSGGSDNHLVLVDLRPLGHDGARVEKILGMTSITLNKNSVPSDKSTLVPGGIRIGAPAMTTRQFTEKEFIATVDFIHEGVRIAFEAKGCVQGSNLQDFKKFIKSPRDLSDRPHHRPAKASRSSHYTVSFDWLINGIVDLQF